MAEQQGSPDPGEIVGWGYVTSWGTPITFGDFAEARTLQHALLHASSDMHQVIAACDALEQLEPAEEPNLVRALETAIVVCYCRAFTQSKLRQLDRTFAPPRKTPERELHRNLMTLRKKAYAHTDPEGGRLIIEHTIETRGDTTHVEFSESFHPLDNISGIHDLAAERSRLFQLEATRIGSAVTRVERARSTPSD
jgi:hypothetical protein